MGAYEGIRATTEAENEAITDADTARYFDLLAEDCEMLPPGTNAKTGPELRDWLATFMRQTQVESLGYVHGGMCIAGDWAWHEYQCRWRVTPRGSSVITEACFKGLHVLRHDGGTWKIVRNIWNTTPTNSA